MREDMMKDMYIFWLAVDSLTFSTCINTSTDEGKGDAFRLFVVSRGEIVG